LDVARILLPGSASHSLPALAAELGLEQPRPHRAFDDAGATRQLFLRLREVAGALDESIKESMLALVAPYTWAIARFFAEALTAPVPALPYPRPAVPAHEVAAKRAAPEWSLPALSALLSPGGPLATAFPEYEQRDAQVQMLLAVAQILERGGKLVVEAGTGTGKSVAYLIPALARALAREEKVVVSTATHTLQEQLVAKDIPFLKQWLPWDFEVCLLKGRANYVSLRRWRRYLAEPCADAEELRFKLKVLVWINQTESGDRSELRLQRREVDGPGLRALLERLAEEKDGRLTGLVAEIAAQPRLGAGDSLADAGPLALDARRRVDTVFQAASEFVQRKVTELNRRDESLRLTAAIRQAPGWEAVAGLGGDAVTALAGLDARLRRAVAAGRDWLGGEEPDQSLRELEIIRSRLAEAAGLLREAFLEPDANQVYWFVLLARSSNLIVRSAPLNVGS